MRIENDKVLNELFEEEFEKIPFLFRFNRKRLIITLCIMCAFFISTVILVVLFYRSGTEQVSQTIPGLLYQTHIKVYDDRIGVALFFSCFGLASTVFMIFAAKWFEKRAFERASRLANMISISERRIEMERWQKTREESHF